MNKRKEVPEPRTARGSFGVLQRSVFILVLALSGASALAQGSVGDGATPTPTLPPPVEGEDRDPLLEMPGPGADPAASAPRFDQLDENRDGSLTRSEIEDLVDLHGQFAALDRDGNRSLNRKEFAGYAGDAQRTPFGQLDDDGDGRITRVEANGDARVATRFTGLDRNRDGMLSAAEFAAFETAEPAPGR